VHHEPHPRRQLGLQPNLRPAASLRRLSTGEDLQLLGGRPLLTTFDNATTLQRLQRYSNRREETNGHHRSCTRPMMYFAGTSPKVRLSELLLRWSPITK